MTKIGAFIISLLVMMTCSISFAANTSSAKAQPASQNIKKYKRDFQYKNGIFYIEVSGAPYEMGLQRGTTFRKFIRLSVNAYKENLIRMYGKENADKIINHVLKNTSYLKEVKEYLPSVYQEMRGIAKGANISLDNVLLIQMYEEVFEEAPLHLGIATNKIFSGRGCTAIAAMNKDGDIFTGQNMDYTPSLDGQQIMIKYKYHNGKEILMYTFFGQIGGIGANNKGVSVLVNTMPQGSRLAKSGLGSNFLLRAILEQDSLDKAVNIIKNLPRAGSLSYTLASKNNALMVEATAKQFKVIPLPSKNKTLAHTNHVLKLTDVHDIQGIYENGKFILTDEGKSPGLTLERLQAAHEFLEKHKGNIKLTQLEHFFRTPPVNINQKYFTTLQSIIIKYEDSNIPLVYATAGVEINRAWNEYKF